MAEANVDLEEIIKRTQNILGKYVKKPTLSEKLLRKPPFRFLFDIFNVVIKETGYFTGLYTPEELTYENIKDRDDKMKFLQKMIDAIKIATGTTLSVRTSKIVSGHEPEKTNELLALIGEVVERQLDWKSAVQKVTKLEVGKQEKEEEVTVLKSKPPKQSQKDKTKEAPKLQDEKSKVKTKVKETDIKIKENKTTKKSVEVPKKDKEKTARKSSIDKVEKDTKEKKVSRSSKVTKEKVKVSKSVEKTISPKSEEIIKTDQTSKKNLTPDVSKMQEEHSPVLKHEYNKLKEHNMQQDQSSTVRRKSSLVSSEILLAAENVSNEPKKRKTSGKSNNNIPHNGKSYDSLTTSLDNIGTSNIQNEVSETNTIVHPDAPINNAKSDNVVDQPVKEQSIAKRENTFTRENSLETAMRPRTSLRPPSARPASARPGAPRRRDKNVEIVLAPNEPVSMSGINVKLDTFGSFDDDGEHLVVIADPTSSGVSSQDNLQDISAATGVDEKQGHLVQQILKTQKELVQESQDDKQKQKNERFNSPTVRQSSARQINTLRDIVQNLTKSINPLGKLLDFIPEDIDAMQLELSLWRDAYVLAAKELKREQSLTEETTEPLKHQLTQIDESIKEYVEMVDSSRGKILQNSTKILKMLSDSK